MKEPIRQFNIKLYEEHLEEASFLYEQRLSLANDPELTWPDFGEYESRLDAHIDALVMGGGLALEVCRTHASSGEVGELYTAVRTYCRQEHKKLLLEVLATIDGRDAVQTREIVLALGVGCAATGMSN